MAFSAKTISREMEAQIGKAPPCLNLVPMVNPLAPPHYVSSWSSKSALVYQSGMRNGHYGALNLCGGSKRGRNFVPTEYMFSKILTPSDVGKLNRLLIPRRCAEGYFPKISETKSGGHEDFLDFEDYSTGVIWRFRFCLWNNRKTYVLTKGWPLFIKDKNLKIGDVVSFYRDVGNSTSTNRIFIHIEPNTGTMSVSHCLPISSLPPSRSMTHDWAHESLSIGTSHGTVPVWKPLSFRSRELMPSTTMMPQQIGFPKPASHGNTVVRVEKRLRLFGVNIDNPPYDCGDESCNEFTENTG